MLLKFANNEAYYQNNSSKWDNFTRTRGAFVDMFDEAFYSGYRSIADMFSGDIAQSDMLGAMAMEDAMRRGSSTSGGARGFGQWKSLISMLVMKLKN